MEIKVSYTAESGFEFTAGRPNDMPDDEFCQMACTMAGYAVAVVSVMKGQGSRLNAQMIHEFICNNSKRMLEDNVVFSAIRDGMMNSVLVEKGEAPSDGLCLYEFTPKVVRSDSAGNKDD